jgi:hypothetical protein
MRYELLESKYEALLARTGLDGGKSKKKKRRDGDGDGKDSDDDVFEEFDLSTNLAHLDGEKSIALCAENINLVVVNEKTESIELANCVASEAENTSENESAK